MLEVMGLAKAFQIKKKSLSDSEKSDPRYSETAFHSVRHVSFHCDPGEVIGVLGPNGAGKTTTLRMLSTALKPDQGTIRIAGQDVLQKPIEARRRIGFLSSSTGLYDRLTTQENIEFNAKLFGMSQQAVTQKSHALMSELNMLEFADKRAGSLSTGMKQKTAIARALMHDPDVVILDEPTSGLDILAKQTVLHFIDGLKQKGTPVLFSTHHMDEVDRLCDRVVIIAYGETIFEGTLAAMREFGRDDDLNNAFLNILADKGASYVADI
ncbi:ABC transporter ATP-binding protein [Algicola sagamiensis]|uniref:ABC transporter ATP-binding protein n=1 Tax=Algicola sagamiensis TaxID=163869 RepID=UPI00036844C7|nr:ATP-binding cassette domain-containing protein [Algicola sagamiensis]